MVNYVHNANNQAQAIAAAEGIVSVSDLAKELNRTDGAAGVKKSDLLAELVETGDGRLLGDKLLKDLLGKVALAGITFETALPGRQTKSEKKGEPAESRDSDGADEVRLSGGAGDDLEQFAPVKGVNQKIDNRQPRTPDQKWAEIKAELVKAGKSAEEISRLEQQFKAGEARQQMFELLKDSAIMYYLNSDNKISKLMHERGFGDLLQKAGEELGQEAAIEARAEVKSFVLHELENQLILRTVLQDGNFEDCYRLVNVGENAGSEPMKWVNEVWPQQKGNHGLCLLDVPHEATGFVNVNAGNPDARREKEKYEYKDEDEKDLMLNRLRALYMQLVLRPGGFNSLATWFKVRTLKNGLVRLGVYTKDLDEKVQAEAKTLAKIRTVETLEEALLEQASLFDPGKDTMTGNKVKNCLKNLERLGFTLTDGEFAALRDKANRDMYELAEKELAATAGQTGDFAGNRVKQLQKLSARLRAESNIGFRGEA